MEDRNITRFHSLSSDDSFESLSSELHTVSRKSSLKVPSWTLSNVQNWLVSIGFESYIRKFQEQLVDGDLLLQLSEEDLETELEMSSRLHRARFLRALQELRMEADYSDLDKTNLKGLLHSISPELSCYTYRMLKHGINRFSVRSLTEEILEMDIGITNSIHRWKLAQALGLNTGAEVENEKEPPMEFDVFICYRRNTGINLAALIKLNLEKLGFRVYIDIEKYDGSILNTVKNSKHIVVILTPNCIEGMKNDWMHKELKYAFENHKNIVPIFDPDFEFHEKNLIPKDVRLLGELNGIKWMWEYQEACMEKCAKFINYDLNRGTVKEHYPVENPSPRPDQNKIIAQLSAELIQVKTQLHETTQKLEDERKKSSRSLRKFQIDSSDGSFESYECLIETD